MKGRRIIMEDAKGIEGLEGIIKTEMSTPGLAFVLERVRKWLPWTVNEVNINPQPYCRTEISHFFLEKTRRYLGNMGHAISAISSYFCQMSKALFQ